MIQKWKRIEYSKRPLLDFLSEIIVMLNENFQEPDETIDYIKTKAAELIEDDAAADGSYDE